MQGKRDGKPEKIGFVCGIAVPNLHCMYSVNEGLPIDGFLIECRVIFEIFWQYTIFYAIFYYKLKRTVGIILLGKMI